MAERSSITNQHASQTGGEFWGGMPMQASFDHTTACKRMRVHQYEITPGPQFFLSWICVPGTAFVSREITGAVDYIRRPGVDTSPGDHKHVQVKFLDESDSLHVALVKTLSIAAPSVRSMCACCGELRESTSAGKLCWILC